MLLAILFACASARRHHTRSHRRNVAELVRACNEYLKEEPEDENIIGQLLAAAPAILQAAPALVESVKGVIATVKGQQPAAQEQEEEPEPTPVPVVTYAPQETEEESPDKVSNRYRSKRYR